ncbi:MAG: sigma-E processing peptidase SpoIIGA [Blautia sp.]
MQFFLENFCLDFLLLFLTGIAAKLPVRFGRMAAWAACGSVGSCALLLLFPEGGVFLAGAAAVLALLMVKGSFQISFGQKKRLVRSTAVFLGMAFLMGGASSGAADLGHTAGDPLRYCRDGFDLRCPPPEGEVEVRDRESL